MTTISLGMKKAIIGFGLSSLSFGLGLYLCLPRD